MRSGLQSVHDLRSPSPFGRINDPQIPLTRLFTAVAASCILGSQFLLIGGNYRVAVLLWVAGIGLWVLLIYTILTAFTIKEDKPALYL